MTRTPDVDAASPRAFDHPDREVRLAWAWNWFEIVWAFRNDHPVRPWMASARGLDPDEPVLPVVLPIRGAS